MELWDVDRQGQGVLVLGLGLGKNHAIISAILDQNASQYGIKIHHNNCWQFKHVMIQQQPWSTPKDTICQTTHHGN